MSTVFRPFSDWPIPLKICLSFAAVMVMGSILLAMPFSQLASSEAVYFDHLFNSVSMVAVTGLFTVPVASTYNLIGQIISLILIQLGGLGLTTVVSAIILQFGKRVGLKEEVTLQQSLNRNDRTRFRNFILSVVKYTLVIEAIGAALLLIHFVPLYGWAKGGFTSIFLAISAFNNAGFDNLGTSSLIEFVDVPVINTVIPLLIILGGIGFSVWFDVSTHFKQLLSARSWTDLKGTYREFKLHSRLAITWTIWLLLSSFILFLLLEWNNPSSIGPLQWYDKLQAGFFQSATLRTAGFATVNYTQLHIVTLLVSSVFMFIGGSPGGTAGGAKTTTVALVVMLIYSELKGLANVNYKNRTLKMDIVKRALVIVVMFIILNIAFVALMTIFDEHVPLQYLIFESASAFATVGLSADLTPTLSRYSQTLLMMAMFIGRIGPITLFTALGNNRRKRRDITYATGDILIG